MITKMSNDEILDAYQAMDFGRIALDLILQMQEAPCTEAGIEAVSEGFIGLIEANLPDRHIEVHPLSVLSLTEQCLELLGDHHLPEDLLYRSEFEARNLIFSPAVMPFMRAIASSIHEVIQDAPTVQSWKNACVDGIIQEQRIWFDKHPELNPLSLKLAKIKEAQLLDHPSDKSVVFSVLCMQAMGVLSQSFCRNQFVALDEVIDRNLKD